MINTIDKLHKLQRRRSLRVRSRIHGTSLKPRLSVIKSNKHIQAQLIDDEKNITLGSVSTYNKEFRSTEFNKKNKASARKLGEKMAEIAKSKNIKEIIFDRGRFKYHGILAEFADAARAGGLQF